MVAALLALLVSAGPVATPWVPLLLPGDTLPVDTAFVDQHGRAFHWHQLAGKSVVLAFIYTRCREANECPATSAKFSAMQRDLPSKVQLLEVTLDPSYDTPAVLRRYGTMFDEDPRRWTLATGNPPDLLAFARRFNVNVAPAREPGQLEHGEALAIFNPQQRLVSVTAGNDWRPAEALAAAEQAAGTSSNPFDLLLLWFRNIAATCGAALSSNEGERWIRIALGSSCALALIALGVVTYRGFTAK
jgi:cytochrome oxidase Cu insertion factor (SCO1/SenC/PrrC family)